MKLRNKKTGEIGKLSIGCSSLSKRNLYVITNKIYEYVTLASLFEEWEDAPEEPKEFWFVDSGGEVEETTYLTENDKASLANFGNYFATKEEAEQAVEKIKAWKRLKDKGFKFNGVTPMGYFIRFTYDKPRQILDNQQHPEVAQQFNKDLALLFGGEE